MVLVAQGRKFITKNSIFSVSLGFLCTCKEGRAHPEGISALRRTKLFSYRYSIFFVLSVKICVYIQSHRNTHTIKDFCVHTQICLSVCIGHTFMCSCVHSPQQVVRLLPLRCDKCRRGSLTELILILLFHCFHNHVGKRSFF